MSLVLGMKDLVGPRLGVDIGESLDGGFRMVRRWHISLLKVSRRPCSGRGRRRATLKFMNRTENEEGGYSLFGSSILVNSRMYPAVALNPYLEASA